MPNEHNQIRVTRSNHTVLPQVETRLTIPSSCRTGERCRPAPQTIDGESSTGYTGTTAEFILERPFYNGSQAALANFVFALMQGCWYGDAQYGDQPFPLGADGSSPFDGNLTYFNMLNSGDGDLLDIAFSAPDPTSVDGSEILWFWTNYQ